MQLQSTQRRLDKSSQRVVLITGCSSGLGLAIADELYSAKDYRVIATARPGSLSQLRSRFNESDRFLIRALDVTDDRQMDELVNEIALNWGRIDILINNAGICYRSVIEHMDEESELHQLKTNYLGPMSLIRLVIPIMREAGFGHIINVSSVSGMLAMPTMGSYSASKHALDGATEALWYELRPFGIRVSLVQPGFVKSASFRNTYISHKGQMSAELEGPYSEYYRFIEPFIEKLMQLSHETPERIAKRVVRLLKKNDPPLLVPATIDAHLFAMLKWILPNRIFHKLMFILLPSSHLWGQRFAKTRSDQPV